MTGPEPEAGAATRPPHDAPHAAAPVAPGDAQDPAAPGEAIDTSVDQVRALLKTIPVGFAGSVLPAIVLAWILLPQTTPMRLLAWLAMLLLAHAGRVAVWVAARPDAARARHALRWLRWLRVSVFGLGLSWALLPLLVTTVSSFNELLIATVIIAVCGAGVAQQSSDARSALLLTLPPALTMCLRLLTSDDAALRSVGGLSLLYFGYLTLATQRIQASFVELSRLHAQASQRSLHDELTGLPNRHALHQRLQDAMARARRNGTEVAVGYIDLDDFKQVNDRLGHDAGDALLREAARRWKAVLRASELIARLGGDEFAIVIEDIDPKRAVVELTAAFARIERAAVDPIRLATSDMVRLQMTMGVARYPVDGSDMDMLLRQADVAMYQLKQRKATRSRWWQLGLDAPAPPLADGPTTEGLAQAPDA